MPGLGSVPFLGPVGGGGGGAPGVQPGGVILYSGLSASIYPTIGSAYSDAISGDFVSLGPGTFAEGGLTPPAGTCTQGAGPGKTTIAGAIATGPRLTMSLDSTLEDVTVVAPTDATGGVVWSGTAGQTATLRNIEIQGAGVSGIGIQNAGACTLVIENLGYSSGTCDMVVDGAAGIIEGRNWNQRGGTCTTYVRNTTTLDLEGLRWYAPSVCTSGIEFGGAGAGNVTLRNVYARQIPERAIHWTAETVIETSDCDLISKTNDFVVESGVTGIGSSIVQRNTVEQIDSLVFPPTFVGLPSTTVVHNRDGQDPNTLIIGERFGVGSRGQPKESFQGTGATSVVGSFVLSDDGLGNFVDNTAAAHSPSGSPVSLFQGTGVDHAAYFGGFFTEALLCDVSTAMVLGGGAVVWEYNTAVFPAPAVWAPFKVLAALATDPFTEYAMDVFERVQKEHVVFGDRVGEQFTVIDGGFATWIRVRITSAIGTIPTVEQILTTSENMKTNGNGRVQFFGGGAPFLGIPFDSKPLVGSAPGSASIQYSANIGLVLTENRYQNNQEHGNAGQFVVPEGANTAQPFPITVTWVPRADGPADVELNVLATISPPGGLLGSLPELPKLTIIHPLIAGDLDRRQVTTFLLDLSSAKPGDEIAFATCRDATGGSSDTLAGNVDRIDTTVEYCVFTL